MRRRTAVTLMVWLAAIAAVAVTAAEPPHVAEERRAVGFLEVVATGDVDAVMEYMEENLTSETWAKRSSDDWRALAGRMTRHKGIEVAGVMIDRPHAVTLVGNSPVGMQLTFGFEFEDVEPYKMTGFSIEAGRGPSGDANLPPFELAEGADRDAVVAALEGFFQELEKLGEFSGTALVAVDGEPIFTAAQGLATRSWGVPNKMSTRFDLGSINKTFTRVAIAQLADQGKLSLDDTIAKHLPDYPNGEVAAKVTIQHLLDQASGIGDIFTDEFFRSSKALYRQPADFFPLFAHKPLLFEPGEGSRYSNGGFMVLGAIIAAISGQTYAEYVEEHVFAPAGMSASGFFAHDEPLADVAVGYTRQGESGPGDNSVRANTFMLPIVGNSAGSAYATAEDLLRFDEALRHHKLTHPAYTRWVLGGQRPSGEEVGTERVNAGIGIAGGGPGVSAVMESGDRLTLIVLSNLDEPGAEMISRHLRRPLSRAFAR